MVTLIRESSITRPGTTPLTSSVLDHAEVATNDHFGLRNDEGMWPSYNCLDTLVPTPICPNPMTGYKTFSYADWVPGFEFAVHGAVKCSAIGLDREDQQSEVQRVFGLNEGKGVERALLANRFVANEPESDTAGPYWEAPVDLTPASSMPMAAALAVLEGYAAAVYAGVPTIHMPRAAASFLNERIMWRNGKAYTRSGSKVAIGGGYDSTGVPTGEWTLYATGEVYVERSGVISVQSFVLPGDGSGTGSDENGLEDNTVVSLAERMYRVAVDCFVAQATGTVAAVSGGGFGD